MRGDNIWYSEYLIKSCLELVPILQQYLSVSPLSPNKRAVPVYKKLFFIKRLWILKTRNLKDSDTTQKMKKSLTENFIFCAVLITKYIS